jgi:hypothetical protein
VNGFAIGGMDVVSFLPTLVETAQKDTVLLPDAFEAGTRTCV